jgi:predicted acetyltransferase
MASDPTYKIHGIWSKLFKKFVTENHPTSVVSFSDNRLFQGSVYEKMGFKFDGVVTPDYYWVKADRRHHKSALRKTNAEKLTGLTETQLRTAQGYEKVWDLGKKRWLYTP